MTDTTVHVDQVRGPTRRRPDGPNAGVLAVVALVLSVGAVVVPLLISGVGFPQPTTSASGVAAYFAGDQVAATWCGFLMFGASVPIGVYAATVHARLLRLGVRVPGPHIAFFGGIAASIMLSLSGLMVWALGQAAAGVQPPVLGLAAELAFALGGIGFVGGLGLLLAGVAVPALILRLVPRPLAWVGLVLAVLSELSYVAMLWSGFDILLPIGRFGGLLWLAVIGFRLPRTRHEVPQRA